MPKCGEVRIYVLLRDIVIREVELALDTAEHTGGALLCHYVDTNIANAALLRPFVEHPDVGEPLRIERVDTQIGANESLKLIAEIPLV